MLQRLVVPLLAVALGLVIVAPLAPTPALAQAEPTVKVATDPVLGKILVDGKGMTLYLYSRDEKGKSNCYNTATSQCETNWPILRPPAAGAPTGSSDLGGTLGVIDRTDGTKQVTYNQIPLYYWKDDKKAGDTLGQKVGGVWWVLAPGTTEITAAQTPPAPAASPSPAAAPAPAPAATAAPAVPAAKPAAPAQAPVASPAALPRTGSVPVDPMPLTVGFSAAGAALTALGFALIRRRGRRD
ncbi:MAG: hypothetical protein U0893_08815 [Chloroflexota bacterium]